MLCANGARHFPADYDLLTRDYTSHFALFADDDFDSLDIALDLAVDLQDAATDDLKGPSNNRSAGDLCHAGQGGANQILWWPRDLTGGTDDDTADLLRCG